MGFWNQKKKRNYVKTKKIYEVWALDNIIEVLILFINGDKWIILM